MAAHKRHGAPYNRIKARALLPWLRFYSFFPSTSAGLAAPFPAGGYAAGCSQERQAPTYARVTDAAKFKPTHDAPSQVEEAQMPPTSA